MSRASLNKLAVLFATALAAGSVSGARDAARPDDCFGIQVVDAGTGRGVPLVELETTDHVRHYTDNNGWIAFYDPGLMNQRVFFTVQSAGYAFPKDGFGYRGTALDAKPGSRATLKLRRLNVAERLYRITGAGCYRDTMLLGQRAPVRHPLLNSQVVGQDSA
ncbi:MAG: hypothetical protein KGJ60_15170, partial [Verrucomicrobiota bacterium]|nr:hypothetical protein [Verrucomicrobiota bacterium]